MSFSSLLFDSSPTVLRYIHLDNWQGHVHTPVHTFIYNTLSLSLSLHLFHTYTHIDSVSSMCVRVWRHPLEIRGACDLLPLPLLVPYSFVMPKERDRGEKEKESIQFFISVHLTLRFEFFFPIYILKEFRILCFDNDSIDRLYRLLYLVYHHFIFGHL